MTDNTRGALLMMGSMLFFTINDTFVKLAAQSIPLWQFLFLRGVLVSVILAAICWRLNQFRAIPNGDMKLIAVRSLAEMGAAYFFLVALVNMPIANVTAMLQTLPLTVTLAAALLFREPLGWRRLSAILIGFVGMLLIVQPGTEGFNAWTVYVVIAVVFVTARDLATRRMSKSAPSMLITFLGAVAVTVFAGAVSVTEEWTRPSGAELTYLGLAALFVGAAYLCSVMVMRIGDLAVITPFRYTALIWALILGFFVFGDWPDALTLVGAAIIVATGLFTLYRERRLARAVTKEPRRPA